MDDLLKASAVAMARAIRAREISPLELFDAHAARIEALNPALNAIVVLRLDEAREEARRATESAPAGPLHGVPFTVKECIPVAGLPCTAGSEIFKGNVPDADAAPVEALRAAGAILLGKTNLSELVAHPDSVNPLYGATRNPHDPERTAGGSSGGEAAALAAALSPIGLGSDVGGSVRWPAHACGVVGLRPSRGVVPALEHVPPPLLPGFARWGTIGPLARHVEDVELVLHLIAVPRPDRDPDALLGRALQEPAQPARIAAFERDELQPVAGDIRAAVRRAAEALEANGHAVVEAAPPDAQQIRACFDAVLDAEVSALTGNPIEEPRAYFEAWAALSGLERAQQAWMEEHPIALAPVAPTPAFPLRGAFDDVMPLNPGGKLTICTWATVGGLPAAAVPAGRTAEGLPIAVQVIGRRGHDRQVLAIARELERALGGWSDPDESPRSATRPIKEAAP